jgi:hypothetical protein
VAKKKHKKFKFGPKVLIRLIIFFLIIVLLIQYLSNSSNNNTIKIPPLYNYLPESTKEKINTLPTSPVIITIEDKINQIKSEGTSFFSNQVKEIKKMIVKKTADELIKNIDQQ